jgi:hypothetical protein
MDDIGSKVAEEPTHRVYKARVGQSRMPRLAGVGVYSLKDTTPTTDAMDGDACVIFDTRAIRTGQGYDLDFMTSRRQLVRKHLDG